MMRFGIYTRIAIYAACGIAYASLGVLAVWLNVLFIRWVVR